MAFLLAALLFVGLALAAWWEELGRLREQVRAFPWQVEPGWLVAATVLAVAALVVTAVVWVGLFRASGERIGLRHGCLAWFGSNLGRYIPGKVWQLSGLTVYLKARGHGAAAALSSSVLAQVLTLLTGLAAGSLVGVQLLARTAGSVPALVGLAVVLAVLAHPAVVRRTARLVGKWLDEEGARGEGRKGEREAAGSSVSGRHLLVAGGSMLGVWLLYGLGFWCLLRGLVGPAATPGPVVATGIFAASYLAGYLVFVAPGGLVVREGAMAALLTALAPQPVAVAAAVAVTARIWVTAAELLGAGASLMVARRNRKDRGAEVERGR